MDTPLLLTILFVLGFALLDLVALRFGRDSRRPWDPRRDWW